MNGKTRPAFFVSAAIPAIALAACTASDPISDFQATYDRQIEWNGTTSKTCALFTTAEVSRIVGTEVLDSRLKAADSGECQWFSRSDLGVKLAVLESRLWFDGARLPNREPLDGIGLEAYVVEEDGVYFARARTDEVAVTVGTSRRDSAVELLRLTLDRLPERGS